jgi:hypothetical protein
MSSIPKTQKRVWADELAWHVTDFVEKQRAAALVKK